MSDPLNHLVSIWHHLEGSDVPYSTNHFLALDFFASCCLIFSYLSNFEHGVWNFKCKFKKWTKLFQSLNKGTKHLPIQDFKMTKSHFEVRRKHWWFSNHVNCK